MLLLGSFHVKWTNAGKTHLSFCWNFPDKRCHQVSFLQWDLQPIWFIIIYLVYVLLFFFSCSWRYSAAKLPQGNIFGNNILLNIYSSWQVNLKKNVNWRFVKRESQKHELESDLNSTRNSLKTTLHILN